MVQFNRDNKIAYPENYTLDWREGGSKSTEPTYVVGDVIAFDSRRGRKTGTIIEQVDTYKWDIDLGNDNILEDINLETLTNLEKVVDEAEVLEDVAELVSFNWGTKEAKERISDISDFQRSNTSNWNDARHSSIDSKPTPSDYGYHRAIIDYLSFSTYGDDLSEWLKDAKWVDLTDRLKTEAETSYGRGYKTEQSDRLFWDAEYPLLLKKVKKGEDEFLKPKGINNKAELMVKISELKGSIESIEEQKKALSGAEQIAIMSASIAEEMVQRKLDGTRKPSTYKERAKEFSESNADYKGNDYLDILQPKKKKKKASAEKVVVKEVMFVEPTAPEVQEMIDVLGLGLEYLEEKEKETANEEIAGLKLTLEYI